MTSWTTTTKHASTWGAVSRNAGSWATIGKSLSGISALLLENGFYLLQETGDKILLEESASTATIWGNITKS